MKQSYPWGNMEWLAGSERGNASSISVARMHLLPGMTSEAHRHGNCEEAILVVRGKVELHQGEEMAILSAGSCVVVPPGACHALSNIGESEAELTLMYGAGERLYETCRKSAGR